MNAFWSVTMYDGKSQLLIKNPINRYLINSPMLLSMKKNPDGSLTLYIQKNSPGEVKESNLGFPFSKLSSNLIKYAKSLDGRGLGYDRGGVEASWRWVRQKTSPFISRSMAG